MRWPRGDPQQWALLRIRHQLARTIAERQGLGACSQTLKRQGAQTGTPRLVRCKNSRLPVLWLLLRFVKFPFFC